MDKPKEMIVTVYESLEVMNTNHEGFVIHNVVDFSESATGGWYIETAQGSGYVFPPSVCIFARPSEQ